MEKDTLVQVIETLGEKIPIIYATRKIPICPQSVVPLVGDSASTVEFCIRIYGEILE